MSRPKKARTCEGEFFSQIYKPKGISLKKLDQVQLHRDELETLRLCDGEGYTQEEAGEQMGVSRGTIQRILTVARRKTAKALCEGYAIIFVDDEE